MLGHWIIIAYIMPPHFASALQSLKLQCASLKCPTLEKATRIGDPPLYKVQTTYDNAKMWRILQMLDKQQLESAEYNGYFTSAFS